MKIYDCFTFYNELDLLELRLAELYSVVDHFVIVEARTTFQNQPKELFYKNNALRFAEYADKIIHVVVDDMPMHSDPWANERFQRNAILRGLADADPEDIAIIGDVDEILRPEVIQDLRTTTADVFGFRMPYFNFKFNYMLVNHEETYCVWTVASRVGMFTEPEELRRARWNLNSFPYNFREGQVQLVEHAGWHFTYFGDDEWIRNKIRSFAHSELNSEDFLSKIDVNTAIERGVGFKPNDPRPFVRVVLDDYFPKTIKENVSKYQDKLVSDAIQHAQDLLPKT